MAFQAPLGLPNVFAVTSEVWPTMSKSVFSAPSRSRVLSSRLLSDRQNGHGRSFTTQSGSALPGCLGKTPVSNLKRAAEENMFSRQPSQTALSQGSSKFLVYPFLDQLLTGFIEGTRQFRSLRQLSSPSNTTPASHRYHSTLSALQFNRRQNIPKVNGMSALNNRRFLFGSSSSQNLLAHMEKTANNNPTSATAQNAFYSALLRANMPSIIIERYRSGKFASNPASEATYLKAVQQVSGGETYVTQGHNPNMPPEHLQAAGQAVAARMHGGQVGMSSKMNGTGAKEAPLYVVVEESLGSSIFRWFKFLLIFGCITYFSLLLVSLFVEVTGVLKNVRGTQNNEAEPQEQKVKFSDVHGCDEAKEELQELVEFLSNPERFSSLGGKLPKGVLLVGPPGTGKTLLARAVAGEAGVPFFYMSGSEFDEVYVGVGAKRVRDLFNQARGKSPAIIFIDELDAIGAKRNERDAAYVKQTLNQLLTELDGFSQSSGVIILAATNYPQLLDKALTRPGRFDRKVEVGLPDVRGRVDILHHHMKNVPISTDVDAAIIARGTPGFSGADLENLVNQAAIRASRNKQTKVGPKDFDWAKDKIMMGAEARSRVMREKDKRLTAYHEAGHALVAHFSPEATPLYKITIVPRGMALGVTHFLPEMDIVSRNYAEYLADMDVSMGGRAAEELIFGYDKVSSGISADIRSATTTAYALVTQFGYSKKLGNFDLLTNYEDLSSETKQEIEAEVRRLLNDATNRATTILTERRKELELLTDALMEYETLTKEEMEKVLRGEKLDKLDNLSKAPVKLPDARPVAGLKPPGKDTPPSKLQESSGEKAGGN